MLNATHFRTLAFRDPIGQAFGLAMRTSNERGDNDTGEAQGQGRRVAKRAGLRTGLRTFRH